MFSTLKRIAAMGALVAIAACGDEGSTTKAPTGSVKFNLDVPGGQSVDKVDLQLVCADSAVNVRKTLNVVKGEVVVVFGGIRPGDCTVTMTTQTNKGADCLGSKTFTVVPATVTEVVVSLICQGINNGKDGTVKVTTTIESKDCSADRIKSIYASPANILMGEATAVQVELHQAAVVGTPKFTWALRNEPDQTGQGVLSDVACAEGAATCKNFTCTGLGASPTPDARTGLPAAGVFLTVQYEDDDCFDTEDVWVYCLEGTPCGDGAMGGVEQCDDGNQINNDGCSSTCKIELCGDGVVQPSEQCDGTAGIAQGQSCTADCKLSVAPACGDGLVNQGVEQCDGTAGLQANQQCGADCKVVPICGNQIVEAPEQCDNTTDPACVSCALGGTPPPPPPPPGNACRDCIAALPEIGEFYSGTCQPEELCATTLTCLIEHPRCWDALPAAACYCGNTQADIDACESPTFVPKGDCAPEFKAGSGSGATNAEVLARYFDFDYPSGKATIIQDAAFISCKAECF